jgi:hypothetical protein
VILVAGLALALTQRLWRQRMQSSLRNLPIALPFNALHWCVANAPIVAAGVLLLCAWDLITLKLNWMPLPYFPGPDGVLQTLVDDWRSAGQGQPGLAECMTQSLLPAVLRLPHRRHDRRRVRRADRLVRPGPLLGHARS